MNRIKAIYQNHTRTCRVLVRQILIQNDSLERILNNMAL